MTAGVCTVLGTSLKDTEGPMSHRENERQNPLSGLLQRLQYRLLFWDRVLARHLPGLEPGGSSFRCPASPPPPWQSCCSSVWKPICTTQQNRPLPLGSHTSTPRLLLSPGEPHSFSPTGLCSRLETVLTHSSRHRGTCQLHPVGPGPSQTHLCPP